MKAFPVINDENGDDVECDADPHGGAEDGDKRPQRLPVEGVRVHQQTLVLKWRGKLLLCDFKLCDHLKLTFRDRETLPDLKPFLV